MLTASKFPELSAPEIENKSQLQGKPGCLKAGLGGAGCRDAPKINAIQGVKRNTLHQHHHLSKPTSDLSSSLFCKAPPPSLRKHLKLSDNV